MDYLRGKEEASVIREISIFHVTANLDRNFKIKLNQKLRV